jgi:endonuclease YncB( thermonuclease family)
MAKAIEDLNGLKVGRLGLGAHGDGIGTVRQQVHDGDTVITRALGNLSVRFLGVDTPEVSFMLPGTRSFVSIGDARWAEFLADPLDARWGALQLAAPLQAHLAQRTGPGCAANHHACALLAQRKLEEEVEADLARSGLAREDFRFFMAFANEVMDGYGRLLGFLNVEKKDKPRPVDYNARLLAAGLALPYFIWPNINPFRKAQALTQAVPAPGSAADLVAGDSALRSARNAVAQARQQGLGCFDRATPLRLEPFELRYLAGRRAPSRWVIDLSRNDDLLLAPECYVEVANPEDRLFVPAEYVPLWVERGWRRTVVVPARG